MSLMREIREYSVSGGAVAIWWLGQSGYIFKSPGGTVVSNDLYLTDSVAEECAGTGLDLHRLVPTLIQPEELDVDIFTCTHNHLDHTDPQTIGRLSRKDSAWFVGPHPTCEVYRRQGIAGKCIVPAWPGCRIGFRDVTIHGTFAVPTDDSDLNHMGFVFQFDDGPRIWVTGDTDFHELVAAAARHQPVVMIVCINAGFNNLSHDEAAQLAAMVKPRVAIPCHYDMFPDNAVDPRQFRASLLTRAPQVCYRELQHGQVFLYAR